MFFTAWAVSIIGITSSVSLAPAGVYPVPA
jgi:hypothetical protein